MQSLVDVDAAKAKRCVKEAQFGRRQAFLSGLIPQAALITRLLSHSGNLLRLIKSINLPNPHDRIALAVHVLQSWEIMLTFLPSYLALLES